jgi:hypothetical protein
MNERVLTKKEFCIAAGISEATEWRLRTSGKLSFLVVSGRIKYLESHLHEFLKRCEVRARKAA